MTQVEKNMAVEALAQLLDQQPTAYAEVLAACRAMGWNASPTAQPADIIDELPSNVLPFIRRMLALLIYGDGSADSPAVVPATDRLYAQMLARQASPNYPAAGFPSDRDPFTHAPSIRDFAHLEQALSALSARKITNGNAENDGIADGVSLARLLCSAAANDVTEIGDDNHGWTLNKSIAGFPNLEKATLNCKESTATIISTAICSEELNLPELENHLLQDYVYFIYNCTAKVIRANKVKALHRGKQIYDLPNAKVLELNGLQYAGGWDYDPTISNCPNLEEVYMRSFHKLGDYCLGPILSNLPKLWRAVYGVIDTLNVWSQAPSNFVGTGCPNLIDLEFLGATVSINLKDWNPSNVIDDDHKGLSDLVPEGSTAQNNLDQFLQNFRSHIAERLTDNGSGLTLTLSQAVFDTIWNSDGTPKSTDPDSVIYQINSIIKTDKHWSVNRA